MDYSREYVTKDFARAVFTHLNKNEKGYIPYHNIDIYYSKKDNENKSAEILVQDKKGNKLDEFNISFTDDYTNYKIL